MTATPEHTPTEWQVHTHYDEPTTVKFDAVAMTNTAGGPVKR